tara:strand:- start:1620 stop:1841 length:222 start_codon:yes stop_codon:yes gene_type:complete
MNQVQFSKYVEDLMFASRGSVTYLDAILEICNRYEIDPLDVSKLLSKPITEKVQNEAQQARLLKVPPMNTLPI